MNLANADSNVAEGLVPTSRSQAISADAAVTLNGWLLLRIARYAANGGNWRLVDAVLDEAVSRAKVGDLESAGATVLIQDIIAAAWPTP